MNVPFKAPFPGWPLVGGGSQGADVAAPSSSAPSMGGDYGTHDAGDFSVSSNAEAPEAIESNFATEKPDETSEAAKKLGAKGGRASAAARQIKPIPDKPTESAPAEPVAASETETVEEKPLGKPRDDPRARMLEATREAAELKRALAAKDAELNEARRAFRPAPPPADAPKLTYKQDQGVKPVVEDYADYNEFVEDLTDWKAGARINGEFQRRQAMAQQQQAEAQYYGKINSAMENYSKKVEEAWPTREAFEAEVDPRLIAMPTSLELGPGERPGPENCIADELVAMDNPVPVMRYLSQNPHELQRIASLSSSRLIAREMAKLEDRASAATTATAPRTEVSRAPRPVRPVTGAPHAALSEDLEELANSDAPGAFERYAAKRKSASR